MYKEVAAKDLKVGDEVLTRYFDEDGAYQEMGVSVREVKVFTRRVRIIFADGFGIESVPANKVYGVKQPEPCMHVGVFATDAPFQHCFTCGCDVPRHEL